MNARPAALDDRMNEAVSFPRNPVSIEFAALHKSWPIVLQKSFCTDDKKF